MTMATRILDGFQIFDHFSISITINIGLGDVI